MKRRVLPWSLLAVGLGLLSASSARAQLSPEDELKTLRAPDGMEVALFASEPMITNPAAIDVDTQGRVWVAEIQWYRGKAKQPPADKIKVLEDTDGDGKADKATVFADGIFAPMSICVAGDKVYVATSPDLWMYEDKNGDLKADGPPKKVLTGFRGMNHDHGAHSLVLGPDHKWWMSHGDTGFEVTGNDGSKIASKWGAMIRGELDGTQLELIASNFRNPYEICMSSFGEAFCSDNDNDGNQSVRICWILEGGDYGWFGSPPARAPAGTPFGEHWHFRGHIPGHVPATLVTGFGSPTGICFYEGDAFGPKFKNAPLHTDCGPRECRIYRHEVSGAGMKATNEVFLSNQGDNYFRPDDISAGPDGRLFVSDWYDGGVGGHGYNNPDQGRIFVLLPRGKKLQRLGKPGPYENIADAIEGLKSPNLATQYLARERLLAEGQKSVPALQALVDGAEPNYKARALWVLDRIGGEARGAVVKMLDSEDATWRALAVRILRRRGEPYGDAILKLSRDKSGEVRREVLLALRHLKGDKAEAALAELALSYDGSDRYMLETINVAAGENKAALYARLEKQGQLSLQQLPLVQLLNPQAATDMLMSKLAQSGSNAEVAKTLLEAAGNIQSIEAGRSVLDLVANPKAPADLRRLALAKLVANIRGSWAALATEDKLSATLKTLLADKELRGEAVAAIGALALRPLGDHVLALTQSSEATPAVREQAIAVASELRLEGAGKVLRSLLEDPEASVREKALHALVDLQDGRTLREVLSGEKFSEPVRSAVANRLVETTGGALVLLRLIDANGLTPALKKAVLAKAVNHPDSNVRVLYEKFVPEAERPKKLGGSITPEEILALKGDAKRGESIFSQSTAAQCKSCHAVQGLGSNLGPDLSMIGKKYERKALLETILEPSKAIAPEFIPHILETEGGQVYAGFLVERTDAHVVLKDVKNQLIRVPAAEVAEILPQQKSLMPELILRDVTAQDAADLLAYLETLKEGTQSVGSFRVLGPLDANRKNLDTPFEPEKTIAAPDLKAEYEGVDKKAVRWELVAADGSLGFAAIDTVKYDQSKGLRPNVVVHYFLVYADSSLEQSVKLLIGSDDGCKVWVNEQMVHKNNASRAVVFGEDQVDAKLKQGRNTIVVKVVNGNGSGGVALGIRASERVDLKTE